MAKIKTAVIFGGASAEHKLSTATAAEIIRNIPTDKYEVMCIGITKKGHWLYFPGSPDDIASGDWEQDTDCTPAVLSPDPLHHGFLVLENGEVTVRRVDVIFPALQGKKGADGDIQGLLDLSGIPYVGCGLLSAASCMDMSNTHMVLDDYGIKTAEWTLLKQTDLSHIEERCDEIAEKFGFPLVVKPAKSGSSKGITKADNVSELVAGVKIAFSIDNKVIVEKFIAGRKLEAAVFGYDTPFSSYIGEIGSVADIFDHSTSETSTGDRLTVPADLPNDTQNMIREVALNAYKALGCKGLARVDFFLTEDGELFLNKIGTAPGLRKNSVYVKLMEHLGMSQSYLIDKLLEQALENPDRNY